MSVSMVVAMIVVMTVAVGVAVIVMGMVVRHGAVMEPFAPVTQSQPATKCPANGTNLWQPALRIR